MVRVQYVKNNIMATKTFKIGEYCRGGIITVETKGNKVSIIGKDWDFSQGSKRGSNQKNAKEWTRLEVNAEERDADRQMSRFLLDLTSSYYTDQVMVWIESKVVLNNRLFW
jgi:hypothetical protein